MFVNGLTKEKGVAERICRPFADRSLLHTVCGGSPPTSLALGSANITNQGGKNLPPSECRKSLREYWRKGKTISYAEVFPLP
ncbi:MAG: hypothetical protein ACI3YH_07590, partial [Eubacteriales bacterium]